MLKGKLLNSELHLNRRQFLRSTGHGAAALATAAAFTPALLSAASPAETVGVGCIGLGTRGGDLINLAHRHFRGQYELHRQPADDTLRLGRHAAL
jgi:hypothetical protein